MSLNEFFRFYLNNFVPFRSPTSTRSKPPFKIVLIVTLPIAEPVSRQHHSLSVRPFPFTVPNTRLPISSPQLCTSNGDKHTVNSPIKITCQCHSSTPCYRSGRAPVMRERAYSNGRVSFVVNLYSNTLRKCQALWMTMLRGSRAKNVSREGGGFKTRECTSSEPPRGLELEDAVVNTTVAPVHFGCRILSG